MSENDYSASAQSVDVSQFDIKKIMEYLPHRYPFLLIDRITELRPGEYVRAYKNVTYNEPFFQGHFPNLPVMPGVLIMEALAQAGGMMVLTSDDVPMEKNPIFLFTGMERVRFRRPVVPGDRLELHGTMLRKKMRLFKMSCQGYVDGVLAAEGELSAAMSFKGEM